MMQGLRVLTKISLCQSVRRPALRMQTTSAWAVGSPVCILKLWPREMILPVESARTDPIGMPPSERPSLASAIASLSSLFSSIGGANLTTDDTDQLINTDEGQS